MEQTEDRILMLNQILSPAFFVKDGIIESVNPAAAQQQLAPGIQISGILRTGAEEYSQFQEGCLYLILDVCGQACGASVSKMNDCHLFILEHEDDQAELQAMALAAQELRSPLSSVMAVAERLFPLTKADEDTFPHEQIARINRGLFQMLRIVSNMSDAYRYNHDSSPRLETRNICAFLQEVFDKIDVLLPHTGVCLRFTNLPEPIYCLIDAEKLERAVNNILSNILKATKKGSTIDARLTQKGNMLCLTVHSPWADHLSGYYRSNFQRRPGLEDERFGIGLGMVLIRAAAAAHGGTVLMEQNSEHGNRTTLTIAIRHSHGASVRSPILCVDYAGERDHQLIELSDCLPLDLYYPENTR